MVLHWLKFCIAGVLLAPYATILAQEISSLDLVKGNYGKYATTLKLADLPDGYSAVRLAVANTDPVHDLFPLFALGGQQGADKSVAQFRLSQYYWSNGDVVTSKGREYLVTYKVDWDVMAQMTHSRNFQDSSGSSAPSPQPTLKINLIGLNAIESVEPCPDVSKKDLLDAFGGGVAGIEIPGQMQARQTATLSNVKQIALGLLMYSNDYDDWLPYAQSSKAAWYVEYPYVKNIAIFKTLNPKGGVIRFNMGISGSLMTSIAEPATTVLLYDSEAWPDGRRAVGFVDGHAKLVTQEEWADLSKHLTPAGIKRAKKPLPLGYEAEFDKLPPPRGAR